MVRFPTYEPTRCLPWGNSGPLRPWLDIPETARMLSVYRVHVWTPAVCLEQPLALRSSPAVHPARDARCGAVGCSWQDMPPPCVLQQQVSEVSNIQSLMLDPSGVCEPNADSLVPEPRKRPHPPTHLPSGGRRVAPAAAGSRPCPLLQPWRAPHDSLPGLPPRGPPAASRCSCCRPCLPRSPRPWPHDYCSSH